MYTYTVETEDGDHTIRAHRYIQDGPFLIFIVDEQLPVRERRVAAIPVERIEIVHEYRPDGATLHETLNAASGEALMEGFGWLMQEGGAFLNVEDRSEAASSKRAALVSIHQMLSKWIESEPAKGAGIPFYDTEEIREALDLLGDFKGARDLLEVHFGFEKNG